MRPYCESVKVDFRQRMGPPHRQSVAESVWLGSCGSSWLSYLQGFTPLKSQVRPEDVLPAPAFSQDLSLWSCAEPLRVEEFIPEAADERLGKDVLPRGSRLDAGRDGGAASRTPAP